jgi:predicted RNase H-like HicB family nuclease
MLECSSEEMSMTRYTFTASIWEEDGAWVARCAELGVASAGDTAEEALENLREAVELYVENAQKLDMLDEVTEPARAAHRFTSSFEIAV